MVDCYLGLGSNMGDRRKFIERALECLGQNPDIRVEKQSSIVETLPESGPLQDDYLNQVVKIKTSLSPWQLLSRLQNIEQKLGRVRMVKNGPRTIDLDILL